MTTVIGPMCIYGGHVVMPLSSGFVGLEDDSTYQDAGVSYISSLVTSWIADPSVRQSPFHFRRIGALLEVHAFSYLKVEVRANFQQDSATTAIGQTIQESFGNPDTPDEQTPRLRWRTVPVCQVVSSLELTISDTATINGSTFKTSSEGWSLKELEFELAPRRFGLGRPMPVASGS